MRDPSWWGVGIGLAMVASAFARKRGASLFSPARIFLLTHGTALAVSFLNLHDGMSPWGPAMWLVYPGAVLAFLAGCASFSAVRPDPAPSQPPRSVDWFGILVLVSPFLIALVAGVTIARIRLGGFPLFSESPEVARRAFVSSTALTPLGVSFHVLLVAVFSYMIVFGTGRFVRATGWLGFLLAGAIILVLGIRNPFLMQIFVLVALWDLGRARLRLAWLTAVGTAFMVVFVAVAWIRSGMDFDGGRIGAILAFLADPKILDLAFRPIYVYIANNFWNLDFGLGQVAMGGGHPTTWGASSSEAIFSFIGFSQDFCERMGWDTFLNESSQKVQGLNTFTYIWPLFKDGGVFLVLGFSWLWGASMTWLYRKALVGDGFDKLLYAYLLFSVAFSFFAFYYQVGTYLVSLAILLGMKGLMRGDRLFPSQRRIA